MYWDQTALTFALSVLDLLILFTMFRFKVISGKQVLLIFIGNFLFFWCFNQIFTNIPIVNHTPTMTLEEMRERGSEWYFLHYINFSDILADPGWYEGQLYEALPTLSVIGVSFFHTLALKWHRRVKWALVSCLVCASVFVLFPVIENRLWGGFIARVNMPFVYLCLFFYIIGYFLCRLFLFLMKKYNQIKESELELESESNIPPLQ